MGQFLYRRPIDEFYGSLSQGASALDTTLYSDIFSQLNVTYDGNMYSPLVLADDAAGSYEIVYISGHSAAAQSVSVLRGQEGTTSRSWPAGTAVRCAPTGRDANSPAYYDADLQAMQYIPVGANVTNAQKGLPQFKTLAQGLVNRIGATNLRSNKPVTPGETGKSDAVYGASNIQPYLTPVLQSGMAWQQTKSGPAGMTISGTASGIFWDLPKPFPNGIISAIVTTKNVGGCDDRFEKADFYNVENGTRLWFACTDGNNVLVPGGTWGCFSVIVIGA